MHILPHIPTQDLDRTCDLARDCHATRSFGCLTGGNGTGKTEALRALQRRWPKLDLPGKAFYLRATQIRGHTSGLKDLLEGMGRRQAGANASGSLTYTLKVCRLELERQGIRGVLVDEADLWGIDGLSALVALYDSALEIGQPLTVILASATHPGAWMHVLAAGRSRALRTLEIKAMSVETMVSVLRAWGLDSLAVQIEAGDGEAGRVATRLHTHCGGLFRRLSYFASLHRLHCPGQPVTAATLGAILPRMSEA